MFEEKNRKYLKQRFPQVGYLFENRSMRKKNTNIEITETKIGVPTILVSEDHNDIYLHSKYDPISEAKKIIDLNENAINEYKHVFIYGLGLSYHIDYFISKFPDKKISIYEPIPEIFDQNMSHKDLGTIFGNSQIENIFVEYDEEQAYNFLLRFSFEIKEKVLLLILPSYERVFKEKLSWFLTVFKDTVQRKIASFTSENVFAKRWTLNSLMNLPTTLTTPNLLKEKYHEFCGKPVLIVSAGPSLENEYEHIKLIKKKGLAYIIAVGSANEGLIANGILPDAICTYDPQEHNYNVFKAMIKRKIFSVPMIYGTSVGYETLQKYKGPKLHVVTSQDTITSFYNNEIIQSNDIVDDAFSIAIITLQIFARMNVSSIILVGQNFAFKNDLYYSKDIQRGNGNASIQEKDIQDALYVLDVFGKEVETNRSLNQMRLLMEHYIHLYSNIRIINTTNGGASIKGTIYMSLEEVIKTVFKERVVNDEWYKGNNLLIKKSEIINRITRMNRSIEKFSELHSETYNVLYELNKVIENRRVEKITNYLLKFDKVLNKLLKNEFFVVYVRPVTRVFYELLLKETSGLKDIQDPIIKGKKINDLFGYYLDLTEQVFNEFTPIIKSSLHPRILEEINGNWKFYSDSCGVYNYSMNWNQSNMEVEKETFYKNEKIFTFHQCNCSGSTIRFKFKGTAFRIIGGQHYDCSNQVIVTIDGKQEKFSTKKFKGNKGDFTVDFYQVLYGKSGLKDILHEIEIEILNNEKMVFQGIEIDKQGRIYHLDEVTDVKDLEIGKRIRCHYKASENEIGSFNGLGQETGKFISVESDSEPEGDFYLVMVDQNEDGKVLISDRNIQHSISYMQILSSGIGKPEGEFISFGNMKYLVGLLTGGSFEGDKNDWDQYIQKNNNVHEKEVWFDNDSTVSWTNTKIKGTSRNIRRSFSHNYKTINTEGSEISCAEFYNGFRPKVIMKG
ncbi:6-hydroxymethylpterin diphosphokinase MptE-like protein [Bacillus salitolerans]|uniref:6-hydroxymethylpterin diphosphokinase MptE-like protein n=1 Tax=Bacillus salitolerans TaxID=1437434 RepID=A0ABW4LNU1_9BACI